MTRWSLVAALCSLLGLTLQAKNWPAFRGPTGQGHSTEQGLAVEWNERHNVLWKTPVPGPGGSSPIVHRDRIYLTCYSGYAVPDAPGGELDALRRHLLCLDRASGRQVLELLRSAALERGRTIVMVTHDPLAASYADTVLFLADGLVVGRLHGADGSAIAATMSRLER